MGQIRARVAYAGVGLLLCAAAASCNNSKIIQGNPGSPTPTPATPSPTATVTRVTISGNVPLTEIGATAQLTAMAQYSDGAAQDVTQQATWVTTDARVVTVARGFVTVVGFGQATISATMSTASSSRSSFIAVRATPPGTSIVAGGVREPGQGWLPNVEVVETMSGRSTFTNAGGEFSFGDIRTPIVRFAARPDSYEPAELEMPSNPSGFADLPIQKVIRFAVGETVNPPRLAPNDLAYTIQSTTCIPCRMLRVVAANPGTVRFRITWSGNSTLSLLGRELIAQSRSPLVADVALVDPGEHILYFGSTSGGIGGPGVHVTFTIETTMP